MGLSKGYQELAALGLAMKLAEMADDSRTVWATVDVLAEQFGMKRHTITAMIAHLEQAGIVWKGRGKITVTLRTMPLNGTNGPVNGTNGPVNGTNGPVKGTIVPLKGHEHEEIKDSKTLRDHESLRLFKESKKNTHAHPASKPPNKLKRVAADDPGFKEFWASYPRRVGKLKAAAWWERRWPNDEELMTILEGLDLWAEHWQARGTELQYIPHPATWLSAERWNEEPT